MFKSFSERNDSWTKTGTSTTGDSQRQGQKPGTGYSPTLGTTLRDSFRGVKEREVRPLDRVRERVRPLENTYDYHDISYQSDIRILQILRGNKQDNLKCRFSTVTLPSPISRLSVPKAKKFAYSALSYVWGVDEARIRVEIYDDTYRQDSSTTSSSSYRVFPVRENLAAALRQLRNDKEDVNIWVDALCINQKNMEEKTVQVSRMHEIYREADDVRVWLGAGNSKTKETFKFLECILDLQHLDEVTRDTKGHHETDSGEENRKNWALVLELMANRWFSRRWVIQELALARKASVHWGEAEIPWSKFATAIALFMTKLDDIDKIIGKIPRSSPLGASIFVHATSNLFRRSEDGMIQQRLKTLEELVSSIFLAFEASEPRDTIYAVLSLAKDASLAGTHLRGSSTRKRKAALSDLNSTELPISSNTSPEHSRKMDIRISPDYSKSLTQVCADFVEFCIEKSRSLDILCRHWAPAPKKLTLLEKLQNQTGYQKEEEEEEKMPTWILSVEGYAFGSSGIRRNGDSFVGELERKNQQRYNASAGLPPDFRFRKLKRLKVRRSRDDVQIPMAKLDRTLYVKGFSLGSVKELSDRVSYGVIPRTAFAMGGWPLEPNGFRRPGEDDVPDKLWRTLVGDRGLDGANAPIWYRRACSECLQGVDPNGDLNTESFKTKEGTPRTMVTFLERVQRVVWNRRFFVCKDSQETELGELFGLGPPTTDEKDIICILFGCNVPVLLRKESKIGVYTFIGECYVHGIMDGEAVEGHEHRKIEEFNII